MFRHVLTAVLRNLANNRLYAAISILSLAVGMAAAILTGLYIRDELGFDSFIPGHARVHVVMSDFQSGTRRMITDGTPNYLGPQLALDFKDAEAVSRLVMSKAGVRHGEVAGVELVGWVDPDFFAILPAPVLAGDPVAAMHDPNGVVITRDMARKYLGRDDPLGEIIELDGGNLLRVGAVLKDLPSNTNLPDQIYASNLNAIGGFKAAPLPPRGSPYNTVGRVYVRVADAAAAARINAGLLAFYVRNIALPDGRLRSGATVRLSLVPLSRLHLHPVDGKAPFDPVVQGSPSVLMALGLTAAMVLLVGAINFVNLMTARAARRAVEVGVRKTAGAQRGDLILQFIGEAVLHALVAFVLALAIVELLLPSLRVLLDRPLELNYWREPVLIVGSLAAILIVGVLAGAYPALVQSGFRPAAVLKGVLPQASGSAGVRAGLSTLQFASLIGLLVAAVVVARQTHYTLNEGLKLDKDKVVILEMIQPRKPGGPPPKGPVARCRDAFPDRVRTLPGVSGAACAQGTALDIGEQHTTVLLPTGATEDIVRATVDFGFFELYGLRPMAGRFFSRVHPEDETSLEGPPPYLPKTVVINQMAVRALGFASPAKAVGQRIRAMNLGPQPADLRIVGVTPDFAFDLLDHGKRPRMYAIDASALNKLNIKLNGRDVPGTLRAIDALWRATGAVRPPERRFVDDYLQSIYVGVIRQGYLLDGLCAVAVFLAGLGLFGLASFTAERRTKEIGVRKAMGASRPEIVGMLLWSFTRPVLWANLIAWPLAFWALNRWLEGFVRHISLDPWLFVAASAVALLVAWTTVLAHTLRVAGARPVGALRYE